MKQFHHEVSVATRGKGLYDFTREVERWVSACDVTGGLLTVFIQHTSASLTIQEKVDPDVILDLNDFFGRLAPENDRNYRHTDPGPDDMPAHIRSALTQTHLPLPVANRRKPMGL